MKERFTVRVNLENVCLDGCEATVVPFFEHSRNTRDRKKMMADLRAQTVLTVQMTAYKACVN